VLAFIQKGHLLARGRIRKGDGRGTHLGRSGLVAEKKKGKGRRRSEISRVLAGGRRRLCLVRRKEGGEKRMQLAGDGGRARKKGGGILSQARGRARKGLALLSRELH